VAIAQAFPRTQFAGQDFGNMAVIEALAVQHTASISAMFSQLPCLGMYMDLRFHR